MSEFKEYVDEHDKRVWAMPMDYAFKLEHSGWTMQGEAGGYICCKTVEGRWWADPKEAFERTFRPVEETA